MYGNGNLSGWQSCNRSTHTYSSLCKKLACMPAVMAHVPSVKEYFHFCLSKCSVQLLIVHAVSVAQHSDNHKALPSMQFKLVQWLIYEFYVHREGDACNARAGVILWRSV